MILLAFSAFTVHGGPMSSGHLNLLFLPVCKVRSVLCIRGKHLTQQQDLLQHVPQNLFLNTRFCVQGRIKEPPHLF